MRLLLIFFLSALLPLSAAGSGFPIHENPATARESPNPAFLLLSFGEIMDLIAAARHGEARSLLDLIKRAHIPEELKLLARRYSEHLSDLSLALEELERTLNLAEGLLRENRLEEAKEALNKAEELARRAEGLLLEVERATERISRRAGALGAPAGTELSKARERLERALRKLADLQRKYEELLEKLRRNILPQKEELLPVLLTLKARPCDPWVGGEVRVEGELLAESMPLPGREVRILLDGREARRVRTDGRGIFESTVEIPRKYTKTMTLKASFIPEGEDAEHLRAAESPPVLLHPRFWESRLEIEVPEKAHPGLPLKIRGRIESQGPPISRSVEIELEGRKLASIRSEGDFLLELTLPPDIPPGVHILRAELPPSGVYAGDEVRKELSVERYPLSCRLHIPPLVPVPGKVKIEGEIRSAELFPSKVRAEISFRGGRAEAVAEEGKFKALLRIPYSPSLAGPSELVVKLIPEDPWFSPKTYRISVFSLNLLSLGLLGALLLGAMCALRRSRIPEGPPMKELEAVELSVPEEMRKPEGPLGVFWRFFRFVESITRKKLKPSSTLREFLSAVEGELEAGVREALRKFVALLERILYAPAKPSRREVEEAEREAEALMGEGR